MSGRKQKEKRRRGQFSRELRIERLEQRQELAHMIASSSPSEVVRVSFLDQNGETVHAEFSGTGHMTVSLDDLKTQQTTA